MNRSEGRSTAPPRRRDPVGAQRLVERPGDVAAARRAAAGVRLRACVVVARVRELTRLAARLEPERVGRLLEEFYATMTDIAVARRATIDSLLGEAIVLLFGVPSPRRDDPLRAVRAAVEMQGAFLALRNRWLAAGEAGVDALALSIGVAAGEVLIANVRSGVWPGCTAIGEPVQAAEELCAAARGAETLIDEAAHASAAVRLDHEVQFSTRPLGGRGHRARSAYRVRPLRAGLRVVPPRLHLDPVCGSLVDPRQAVREGDAYFCSAACARRFGLA